MAFNPRLLVPFGYRYSTVELSWLQTWLLVHHHPEYVRRLVEWLDAQGGKIGVGGGWRATQPDLPGFAEEGRSFHQDQQWADGFVGAGAVDLVALNAPSVHRSPRWDEVPAQGSGVATAWGLHCNVPGEPWHIQGIEYDGWLSWTRNGRKAPVPGYPLPDDAPPLITSAPPPVLRQGQVVNDDTKNRTRWLQQILNERFGGRLTVDGLYGNATVERVKFMQSVLKVTADGAYGSMTANALAAWLSVQ